jgi:hypothetical protein
VALIFCLRVQDTTAVDVTEEFVTGSVEELFLGQGAGQNHPPFVGSSSAPSARRVMVLASAV